ncbi:hypothetical protein ACS386_09995 [Flavobacteriaceae bacterium LMO-SS05]
MKIIFGLLVLVICSNECHQKRSQFSNQEKDNLTITYEASSRGFYEKIWITKDSISFSNDRNLNIVIASICKKEDWDALVSLLNEVDIKGLSEMEAPSKMHQVDGAAMATFKVEVNSTPYETHIFDHGYPPKTISELVNKVFSIKDIMAKH